MTAFLKKLIKAPAVPGSESKAAAVISEAVGQYADSVRTDSLGNLIVFKRGGPASASRKKLLLAAHMDEAGFTANCADDKGFIHVANLGEANFGETGWIAAAYNSLIFENGARGILVPVSGGDKIKQGDLSAGKFAVDIGASDRRDAEKRVKTGEYAVLEPSLNRLAGRRYAGHPVAGRIGCAVLIEAIRSMGGCACDTYFVFAAQGEAGYRGAKTAAFGIAPDYAVAFDAVSADSPDSAGVKLGAGAAIILKDNSVLCDTFFTRKLIAVAKENDILYQTAAADAGGTDASAIQSAGAGTAVGAVAVPARYLRTGSEMFDMRDAEAAVKLAIVIAETGYAAF